MQDASFPVRVSIGQKGTTVRDRSTSSSSLCTCYNGKERREKARILDSFSARVQGIDLKGRRFELDAVLENLSSSGLYMRVREMVREGDQLSIRIHVPPVSDLTAPGLNVAAQGEVLRVDRLTDDYGVAVRFKRRRIM